MRRPIALCVASLAFSSILGIINVARAESTFSADDAVAVMRRSHPLLRAANGSVRVAEAVAVTTGHWMNPVVDASYFKALTNSSYDVIGTPAVGVTQFLEIAGAPGARRRSANAEVRAVEADRDALARELEWNAREAFAHYLAAEERRRIRGESVRDLERAASIVRSRVSAGVAPRYDGSRIEIAVEQARADGGVSAAEAVRARGELDVAIGPLAKDAAGQPVESPTDALDQSLPSLLAIARERRPDLVAARARIDSATSDIDAAKRAIFPGFGLRVGVGFGQAPGQFDVGFGLVAPIPVFERGQGTVVAAEARSESARYAAEALTVAVGQRIAAAHAELEKRLDTLARFRDQASTLSGGMRAEAEAGYREARLSVLELVDAYHSLRDVQLRLIDLAELAAVSKVQLGRAVSAEGSK